MQAQNTLKSQQNEFVKRYRDKIVILSLWLRIMAHILVVALSVLDRRLHAVSVFCRFVRNPLAQRQGLAVAAIIPVLIDESRAAPARL